jgi:hypothetical protein
MDCVRPHDFQWKRGVLACTRCGVVDISGQRLVSHVKAELEMQGFRFYLEGSAAGEAPPHEGRLDNLAAHRPEGPPEDD